MQQNIKTNIKRIFAVVSVVIVIVTTLTISVSGLDYDVDCPVYTVPNALQLSSVSISHSFAGSQFLPIVNTQSTLPTNERYTISNNILYDQNGERIFSKYLYRTETKKVNGEITDLSVYKYEISYSGIDRTACLGTILIQSPFSVLRFRTPEDKYSYRIKILDNYSYDGVKRGEITASADISYKTYQPIVEDRGSQYAVTLKEVESITTTLQDITTERVIFSHITNSKYSDYPIIISDISITVYFEYQGEMNANSDESGNYVPCWAFEIKEPLHVKGGVTEIVDRDIFINNNGGGGTLTPTELPNFAEWLIDTIDTVFSEPILGKLSLGEILWFVIGISLLFVVLKLFAGG